MTGATVAPESGSASIFEHRVSTLQTGVSVTGDKITGTLKYVSSGALPEHWGAGNFLALKFSNFDQHAEKVYVGLEPSEGSGLVDIIPDPDKNGAFKITDPQRQKLVVMSEADGYRTIVQRFDLSGLTLQAAE